MRVTLFLVLFAQYAYAQTAVQQKSLNNYADYANQSADEIAAVVMSVIQYYPTIHQKSSFGAPRYNCPVQLEDFYIKTALAESRALPAAVAEPLNKRLKELEAAAQSIDDKCKALDTYHKLEDYKKDNFAQAAVVINELQIAVRSYRTRQDALSAELENAIKKLNPTAERTAYGKADAMLKKQIERERAFLDTWTFNLNEAVPTGWPVDKLQQSIAETAEALNAIRKEQPALKYPTSSMWSNFQESLSSVLDAKRNALDEYNNEAKKSDRHGNDSYLGFINYFNGTLVSDQNAFILYASNDGYHGLKSIKYFPLFEIRSQAIAQAVSIKPFADYPRSPLNPPLQKAALSKPAYGALVNYIEYINETGREIDYLAKVLRNLSGRAAYLKTVDSYERQGGMSFDYKDFQLPLSQYQKTLSESNQLPQTLAKPLNQQAEVLMNILKELDAISATLEAEAAERKYEKDRVAHVFELLERTTVLIETWDDRKELLYDDVRKVFDSYPAAQSTSSWYVSGKALQHLTDLDHDALFKAKAFYRNGQVGATTSIATGEIDPALRDVISKEFQNMKGIEKYGRYNGLCPYSPYEDLPVASKKLSEKVNPLATGKGSGYQHPYYDVLYQYNEVVRNYNKFCELSKAVFLLPTILQPELFELSYPSANREASTNTSTPRQQTIAPGAASRNGSTPGVTMGTAVTVAASDTPVTGSAAAQKVPGQQAVPSTTEPSAIALKVKHDTVYIERRDTVYLADGGGDLRSMEGYAVNNMILLLDVSGSMNAADKLPVLKSSVLELISMMRPEDKVSIIAFSDKPKALLTAASFKDEVRIQQAINSLKPSGKTDGNAGVKLAYKVADENYIRGGNNRIILATDGEFALHDDTRELIQKFSGEDIFLSIFNFGKGAGASKALEQVALMGKGNYQHISKDNVELQLIREVKAKRAR